jgi:uncharacterized OsmC-like protein
MADSNGGKSPQTHRPHELSIGSTSPNQSLNRLVLNRFLAGRGHCDVDNRFDLDCDRPVKITLLSDNSIRLEPIPGPMTIEALSADQSYSPFHMVAGGLASCTFSVMYAWAEYAKLDADDLTIDVTWTFADDPHRVDHYDVRFNWPSLPEKRMEAARRVAELCTIHATLRHPPTIEIASAAASPLETSDAQADGAEPVAR